MPAAFKALHRAAPKAQLEHFCFAPDEIELALLDGRIEIGIGGVFHKHKPGLTYEFLYQDPVELYCGETHPLFQPGQAVSAPEKLDGFTLARRAYLSEEDVAPETAHLPSAGISHQIEGVAMFVLSGEHLGYLPASFASRWVSRGKMQAVKPEVYGLQTNIEIATKRGANLTSLAQKLHQLILKQF